MTYHRNNSGLTGGMMIVLATASLLIASCSSAVSPRSTSRPEAVPLASGQDRIDGGFPDALDTTTVPGVPLDKAQARVGPGFKLPDPSLVGEPTKVVVDEDRVAAAGEIGLLIAYDSGIKLAIEQRSPIDFQREFKMDPPPKFTDGRTDHYAIKTIAGRETWVVQRGVQVLGSGDHEVSDGLTWNAPNGLVYVLRSNSDSVSLDTLIRVAESIR